MSVIVDSRRREDIEEEEKRKKAGIHTLVESDWGDFPGGPMAKTLCSLHRGPGLNPWSGN